MANRATDENKFACDVATYETSGIHNINSRNEHAGTTKSSKKLLRSVIIGFGTAFFLITVAVSLLVILGYGSQETVYEDHRCNNFHSHACKMWKMEERSGKDLTSRAEENFYQSVADIGLEKIKLPTVTNDEKMKLFYQTCMNTDGIEKQGLDSMISLSRGWPLVNGINWHGSTAEAFRFLATVCRTIPFNGLFTLKIGPKLNSKAASIWITSNEEMIFGKSPKSREDYDQGRQDYTNGIFTILKSISKNKQINAKMATQVEYLVELEEALAEFQKQFNPNIRTRSTLGRFSKETNVNWTEIASVVFRREFSHDFPLVVVDKNNMIKIIRIAKQNTLGASGLVHLSIWSVIQQLLPHLDSSTRATSDFIQKSRTALGIYSTSLIEQPRTQYCVDLTLKYMPWVVGKQVNPDFFRSLSEAKIIVKNVMRSLWDKLDEKNISRKSKKIIQNKFASMALIVGGPDWLQNPNEYKEYFQTFPSFSTNHLNNVLAILKWNQKQESSKITKRNLFEDSLIPLIAIPSVNYSKNHNALIISLTSLMPPIYNSSWSLPEQYGILGTLIAHELIHMMHDIVDNQKYKTGAIVGGQRADLKDQFEEEYDGIKCLSEQYSGFCPLKELRNEDDPVCVNGEKTLYENIADNGAVRHSYYALKKAMEDCQGCSEKVERADFTTHSNDELFFYSYAKGFCPASSMNEMKSSILNSDVSPREYRAVGSLSNFPQFAKTFQCSDGNFMSRKTPCEVW